MSQYLKRKLLEARKGASADAAVLAKVIAGSPLEPWVCALSGIEPERLCALAEDDLFAAPEFLALFTAVEAIIHTQGNGWENRPSWELTGCQTMNDLIALPQATHGRQWLDWVSQLVLGECDFCAELVEASTASNVDEFLTDYRFFVDTSALCDEAMQDFVELLIPAAERVGCSECVVVPNAVFRFIQEEEKNGASYLDAAAGLARMRELQAAGLLSVRGDKGDTIQASVFVSALAQLKPTTNLVLLTQDEHLAWKVQQLNEILPECGADILVASLETDGSVQLWLREDDAETDGDMDSMEDAGNSGKDSLEDTETPDKAGLPDAGDSSEVKKEESGCAFGVESTDGADQAESLEMGPFGGSLPLSQLEPFIPPVDVSEDTPLGLKQAGDDVPVPRVSSEEDDGGLVAADDLDRLLMVDENSGYFDAGEQQSADEERPDREDTEEAGADSADKDAETTEEASDSVWHFFE